MLGPHHEVSAIGMRIDHGDVIVPAGAVLDDKVEDKVDRSLASDEAASEQVVPVPASSVDSRPNTGFAPAPVLLAGREGARGKFGGLDLVGSFFGALVTIASLVLIGGVLGAIFGEEAARIDTSLNSVDAVTTTSLLVGAATILVSCFLGGWAAGRSARFDGAANGVMTVVWVLGIGVALAALGAWVGSEYDVFANVALPTFVTDEFALWGSVALAVALVLMLIGGAIGGALGESWHRRADRAMLDVVSVDDRAQAPAGIVGSPATSQPIDDRDAVPVIRSDRHPR
jgi:hypothetical protein